MYSGTGTKFRRWGENAEGSSQKPTTRYYDFTNTAIDVRARRRLTERETP